MKDAARDIVIPRETTGAGAAEAKPRRRSIGLMVGMGAGHGIKHFYQQGVILLLPSIKAGLGLTDVEVGLIGTARTISSAAMNVPAGFLADMWRTRVALMLTASLLSMALGYLVMGVAPNYWLVLLAVAITGGGTSLWHAPAFGTLAAVYPERRALAMSVHRMGGSVGDSISPVIMGALLGGFAFWGLEYSGMEWNALAMVLTVPAVVAAGGVFVAYRNLQGIGRNAGSMRTYFRSAGSLLTNATVLSMVALSGIRSMAHSGLNIFLVLYMSEDLGFPDFKIGYHVTLLTLFGIVSSPLLGLLSDRIGRRQVIFFGLGSLATLVFFLLPFGSGWSFTIILACMGMFLYSVNPVMMATALDAAKKGTEGSGVALMFSGAAIFGAISPVIAGRLRELWGMDAVFYYTAIIISASALASLFVPIRKLPVQAPRG